MAGPPPQALEHLEQGPMRIVLDSLADGFLVAYDGCESVFANRAARTMLKIALEGTLLRTTLKEKAGFYPFELLANSRELVREEVRIGERDLHSVISPIVDALSNRIGSVVVLRDLTELSNYHKRQEEFVSIVSHELRSPLTAITGALDLALGSLSGPQQERPVRYLRMARENSARLNDIIDDLLDVARADQGTMPLHLQAVALDELAQVVTDHYRAAAEGSGIRLRFSSSSGRLKIEGDASRLTQVLNNLLSNALKFCDERGLIEVEVFGPQVVSGHVGVSVFNDGPAIAAEDRERVFEKFEQAHDVTTRKVGGTGLGLAISRAIVEAHGGKIWAEALERGSKFVITLPKAAEPRVAAKEDAFLSHEGLERQGHRVVIVNDDPYGAYLIKGLTMRMGCNSVVALNDSEGLLAARREKAELVILNCGMRGIDVPSLIGVFKHNPDSRGAGIVVLGEAQERAACMQAGADAFLTSPIDPHTFTDRCVRVLRQGASAGKPRVLLADDDPNVRMICRDVLEDAGFDVRSTDNGEAVLEEASRFRPDLFLLDVMMPKLDGFETARRLRDAPDSALAPIIFLSARGETSDKVHALRLGAVGYVVKPFDATELVARVRSAIERRHRELSASPTTQLPGGDAIGREIERRLEASEQVAYCYLDLDNLKAFNDTYGYAKADAIIRQTGDIIREVVKSIGGSGDFIGHIAGDDFVFISDIATVDQVCQAICRRFDQTIPFYYSEEDRRRGHIVAIDRYGVERSFPIMRVSIAAITNEGQNIETYARLAEKAAEGKTLAKSVPGSSYVRNGKVLHGES